MEMLKNQWSRRKSVSLILAAVMLGCWLLGTTAVSVACRGSEGGEIFPFGGVFAFGVLVMGQLLCGAFGLPQEFNLAVSMGVPRKRFVPAYAIYSALEILAGSVLLRALIELEKGIYHLVLPARVLEADLGLIVLPKYLLLGGGIFVAVEMLVGAVWMRFSGWGIFGIWIAFMLLTNVDSSYFAGVTDWYCKVTQGLGSMAMLPAVLLAVLFVAVLFWVAWRMLRKQQVTG